MLALALVFAGFVFLGSGLGKLTARKAIDAFLRDLGVPSGARAPATLLLAGVEAGLGLFFILGIAPRWATVAGAALAAGFLGAHLLARARGGAASCRCFGALDTDLDPMISMVRAAVLLTVMLSLAIAFGLGAAIAGIPGAGVIPLLSGLMASLTYLVIFLLINETVRYIRRHREMDRGIRAVAEQLEAAHRPAVS